MGVGADVLHVAAPRETDPRVGRPFGVDAGVAERLDLTRVEVMAQDRAEVAGDVGDDLDSVHSESLPVPPLEDGVPGGCRCR